jgi:branched-chain amino acid transport system substrate-binding protein
MAISDGMQRRSVLRLLGATGFGIAASGLLAACGDGSGKGAASGGGSGPFLLGEAHATTGAAAATYNNYFIPVNLAVAELNAAGGIAGNQIQEKLVDDQADPSKEPAVFRQLSQDKVQFAIGPNTSSTCLAAVPIATSMKIANLNVATSDLLNDVKKYPYSFLLGPTNTPAMSAIVDFCARNNWKKIALLHSDDTFGTQIVDPITARAATAGVQVVADVKHPVQATDMTPYVQKCQDAKPDAVICVQAIVSVSTSMMNAFKNLNFNVPKIGTTSISSETLRKAVPADVYATTYSVYMKNFSYTASEPVPQKSLDFVKTVTAKAGNFGGLTTAGLVYGTYDFVHLLKLAVEKAGSTDVEKVVAALEGMDPYQGVIGSIKFTAESHDGLQASELVICKAASGGSDQSQGGYLLERA